MKMSRLSQFAFIVVGLMALGSAYAAAAVADNPALATPAMAGTSTPVGKVPVEAASASAKPGLPGAHKGLRFAPVPREVDDLAYTFGLRKFPGKLGGPVEMKALPYYDATGADFKTDLSQTVKDNQLFVYYFRSSGELLGSLEVMFDGNSGSWKIGGYTTGNVSLVLGIVKDVPACLDTLASSERVKAGSYEARIIRYQFPGGGSASKIIWLKSDPGGLDLLYVPPSILRASALGFSTGTLYTVAEFAKAIQAAAARITNPPAAKFSE